MISNQIMQNTIEGIKAITRVDLCVTDIEGNPVAATFEDTGSFTSTVPDFVSSPAESQVLSGHQYFKIYDNTQLEYVLLAKGETDDAYMIGKVAAFQLKNLLVAYKERFDKDNFIKNLLLDNLLLIDIYNRSKKLHIDTDVRRIVFIVEAESKSDDEVNFLEIVRSIYNDRPKDFVTAVDEKSVIVVREVGEDESSKTLYKAAEALKDSITSSEVTNVRVALGTIVNEIKDVSRSYKEAKMALDVGKIFYVEKNVVA